MRCSLLSLSDQKRFTCAGNTETVAGYVAAATGLSEQDIGDVDGATVAGFDGLIVGAPTWHTGADSERSGTAWDDFLYGDLTSLDLAGKKVAVFGVGDRTLLGTCSEPTATVVPGARSRGAAGQCLTAQEPS